MNIQRHQQRGFTLIEVLVVLAIAVVLITIGVPSLRSYVTNTQMVSHANDLVGSFNFARGQAIASNRVRGVQVRPGRLSDDGSSWIAGTWREGWMVWDDKDGDNAIDIDWVNEDNNELLRTYPAITSAAITLNPAILAAGGTVQSTTVAAVVYGPGGTLLNINSGQRVRFELCSARALFGRDIFISATGRTDIKRVDDAHCN